MIYHSANRYYPESAEKSSIFKHLRNVFLVSFHQQTNIFYASFSHVFAMEKGAFSCFN